MNTRHLFVDCGSNLGQGLIEFHRLFNMFNNNDWEIHSFEANPDIKLDFRHVWNLQYFNSAVWVEDTTMNFLLAKRGQDYEPILGEWDLGSKAGELTRLGNHLQIEEIQNKNIIDALEKVVEVPAFDFSHYIKLMHEAKPPDKKIVVKMDVEGAEFKILRHLIDKGTIDLIDILFVETHQHTMPNEDEETTKVLLEKIKAKGVEVYREDHTPGGSQWQLEDHPLVVDWKDLMIEDSEELK